MSFDDNNPLSYVTGMHPKSAFFFAASLLYVTTVAAQPIEVRGMCTTHDVAGVQTFDGGCDITLAATDRQHATVTIDMYNRPSLRLTLAPGICTMNGVPCIQSPPAQRPDGLRFQVQNSGFFEFTRPKDY